MEPDSGRKNCYAVNIEATAYSCTGDRPFRVCLPFFTENKTKYFEKCSHLRIRLDLRNAEIMRLPDRKVHFHGKKGFTTTRFSPANG